MYTGNKGGCPPSKQWPIAENQKPGSDQPDRYQYDNDRCQADPETLMDI
jgi:hypothetical protein